MEPLTGTETALLGRDEAPNPWHLTEVTLLAGQGLTTAEVSARVAERLAYVPRFRQVPDGGRWIDDLGYDIDGHVRPLPVGQPARMSDLQASVTDRLHEPLHRAHPRWDIGVAEVVTNHRGALVTRVQPAWVDGVGTVHLLQELLDDAPVTDAPIAVDWEPQPAPPLSGDLTAGVKDPGGMLRSVSFGLARWASKATADVVSMVAAPERQPRFVAGTGAPLITVQRVARAYQVRVHDVIVAMVAGGLRRIGERQDTVACVPLAVEPAEDATLPALGLDVVATTLALPVRVASATARLDHVATFTQSLSEGHRLVPAPRMVDLPGFSAATLHALGARTAVTGPAHEVLITNVPGPATPRYLGSREVKASYPFLSLTGDQRVSVGVTSYAGQVAFGLTGRTPMDDLAVAMIDELQELAQDAQYEERR